MMQLWEVCGVDKERWEKIEEDHSTLLEIYEDYKARSEELNNVAISLSGFLQKMPGVHSVRWRVKSPEHLISKICRKKESGVKKYDEINIENYQRIVTDLIGMRVLHLMKEDFSRLHSEIIDTWGVGEEPIAYLREGDQDDLRDLYKKLGLVVENHADGYRSIHYIIETNFTKKTVRCELQVRTIFEEGWSEIDHMIRYPDFTDEPLVLEFVNIFNRLSGAADEMGTFALKLSRDIKAFREERAEREAEAARNFEELTEKIEQLERADKVNRSLKGELSEIKTLISRAQGAKLEEVRANRSIPRISNAEGYPTLTVKAPGIVLPRGRVGNEAARRLGFSTESFDEVASTSKKSISDSIAKVRKVERERRARVEGLSSEATKKLQAKRNLKSDDQ